MDNNSEPFSPSHRIKQLIPLTDRRQEVTHEMSTDSGQHLHRRQPEESRQTRISMR